MTKFFNGLSLIVMITCSSGSYYAQTADCNSNAGAEINPTATCVTQPFNVVNNNNYWTNYDTPLGCGTDNGDEWMWFTADATTTTITYNPNGGAADPVLTIFQGACNPSGVPVACADLGFGGDAETVTMSTVPGQVYHIRVQRYGGNGDMNGTICVAGTTGSGSATASDCGLAINVCTDLDFEIDPNGNGAINEIPSLGSLGNPYNNNPGGSGNMGCLQSGEYNSTWMIVNVSTSGNLEFVLGGLGAQAGYYDWIMYPYNGAATCTAIASNTVAPVRCNWNAIDEGGTGIVADIPADGDEGNYEPPLVVTSGQRYIICFSNYSNASTGVPLQFLNAAGNAGVSCTPLGFDIENLSITCNEGNRLISWSSPVSSPIQRSVIQRSDESADNWEDIAVLYNGIEEGGSRHYSFTDIKDPGKAAVYRVVQVSQDGEELISPVISSDCSRENPVNVYPNPSTGLMNVEYESPSDVTFQLLDLRGKVLFTQQLERSMGLKTVQITASDVPDGMYIYQFISEGLNRKGTIILQR